MHDLSSKQTDPVITSTFILRLNWSKFYNVDSKPFFSIDKHVNVVDGVRRNVDTYRRRY